MVDMAHFSGLVAGKGYPNPCDYAHVVTSTTHKVLEVQEAVLYFQMMKILEKNLIQLFFLDIKVDH